MDEVDKRRMEGALSRLGTVCMCTSLFYEYTPKLLANILNAPPPLDLATSVPALTSLHACCIPALPSASLSIYTEISWFLV